MKRIILLIVLSVLISGCTTKPKEEATIDTDISTGQSEFNVEKTNDCNNKVTEYYQSNNRKIYFVCLNEVKIENKIQNESQTLSYTLNKANQDFNSIFGKLVQAFFKESELFKDGGTKIYKNDNATIIVCHKIQENGKYNEDIYIGDNTLELEQDFCSREIY